MKLFVLVTESAIKICFLVSTLNEQLHLGQFSHWHCADLRREKKEGKETIEPKKEENK